MPGKITDLAALTGAAAAATDLLETVDVSDTSMAPTGTNKKMSLADVATFMNANGVGSGGTPPFPNKYVTLNLLAGQTIPHEVLTPVAWTSERNDLNGWHAPNSADIVVPAGFYLIVVQFAWDLISPGARFHHIEVTEGGVTRIIAARSTEPQGQYDDTTGNMVIPYEAAATASFRVQVYQDSGVAVKIGEVAGAAANRPLLSDGTSANTEFTVVQLVAGSGGGGGGSGFTMGTITDTTDWNTLTAPGNYETVFIDGDITPFHAPLGASNGTGQLLVLNGYTGEDVSQLWIGWVEPAMDPPVLIWVVEGLVQPSGRHELERALFGGQLLHRLRAGRWPSSVHGSVHPRLRRHEPRDGVLQS